MKKCIVKGKFIRCRRNNEQGRDYKVLSIGKPFQIPENENHDKVQKKKNLNKEDNNITELGAEQD